MSRINPNNSAVGRRNRKRLERLKSLKENVNWEIEEQRGRFIREVYPLIKNWTDQFPHSRDIFQPKEIDQLLFDVVKLMAQCRLMMEGFTFINFVICTGYKDEPDLDEDGKTPLIRTTPVHFAAAHWFSGRNSIVRQLFKIYDINDVNYTNETGLTHFHVACMCGCYDAVKKFLDLGQDPNCLWAVTGESPLYLAARSKCDKVIELLLKNGADPDLPNAKGQTILHVICNRFQDDSALKKFFEVCDDIRQTIKIDTQDNWGNTPLYLALLHCNEKEAALLLKRGADPNLANAKGLTPLHITCYAKPAERWTEKFLKMCEDNHRMVKINERDELGYTPLHIAMYYNSHEVVELLMRRGADPSVADLKGLTALHLCHNHKTDCSIEMLFEKNEEKHRKVNVNAQDNEGNTPLHLVLYNNGSDKTIESLLRHGADPNMPNNQGLTPFHLVCRKKDDYGSVETFFKMCNENNQQVKVDARVEFGPTPLEWSVARSWPNVVHVLLDHGADLSNFVYPTASLFNEVNMGFNRLDSKLKLKLVSGALSVIETLEKRGYELQQSNVVTIMKVFTSNIFLEKLADLGMSVYDDEEFVETAKQILITPKTLHCNKCGNEDEEKDEDEEDEEVVEETKIVESSSLSLYDLITLRSKQLTSMVYYEAACAIDSWWLSDISQEVCLRHLCEKLSKKFFLSRTVYSFWEMIDQKLPIECCDMIMEELENEDLLNIFLAAAGQN